MSQNTMFALGLSLLTSTCFAQPPVVSPQPTSCIESSFSFQGSKLWFWRVASLTLTNHCGQSVDFQNAAITFLNSYDLNDKFWGAFEPLSEPSGRLQITSQPIDDRYLSTLSLQFPIIDGSNSKLADGGSFTVSYSASAPGYVQDSVKVYLNGDVNTGNVRLTNTTAKPANVTQAYALVNVTLDGKKVSSVKLPWSGKQVVSGLAAGSYVISPANIDANDGNLYEGVSTPAKVSITSGDTTASTIVYKEKVLVGAISMQLQALPDALSGYAKAPAVTMTRDDNHSAQVATMKWGGSVSNRLANKVSYHFSTTDIGYNGYTCKPSFKPVSAIADPAAPKVNLSYTCVKTAQDNVAIKVKGAPLSRSSVKVLFTPNGNAAPVKKTVTLIDGEGTAEAPFTDGTIYTVTADPVDGYSVTYSSQPLTVAEGVTETVSYAAKPAK
ncbi:MAG: hypothetical protein NXI01_01775 [Gammaproteobacteria bacterium]|nr:hypothetical protein [Gammaproteobacteria bacterium]